LAVLDQRRQPPAEPELELRHQDPEPDPAGLVVRVTGGFERGELLLGVVEAAVEDGTERSIADLPLIPGLAGCSRERGEQATRGEGGREESTREHRAIVERATMWASS